MAYKPVESYEEYLKILENYKDYKQGTYQSMTLEEKIDFFDGIHTEHVPMFDEDGNDTIGTLWDYGEISKEFIQHPEMFSLDDISKFLEMLDDNCYQPSFMNDTLKVIRSIIRYHGREGAVFFLTHLSDIPEHGQEYGLCYSFRYLIVDDVAFPYLKEAVMFVNPSIQEFILKIINGEIAGLPALSKYAKGLELERIHELKMIISHTLKN
ncbi:MAG: hypothetical protein HDT39_05875 [Lachnospiraceae bacterium]|nr:hypothetical protein [Lachnospiraceae bacterium]